MYEFQRPFTDEEMQDVKQRISDATDLAGVAYALFQGCFDIVLLETAGKTLEEMPREPDSLDPTDYAIPYEQVVEILEHASQKARDIGASDDARVALTMQWMNNGLSFYYPEKEEA